MRKLLLCVSLLLTGTLMWGQTNTAVITGVVADSAGAVIPGAQVKITSQSTNASLTFATDSQGYFTSVPINPDTYSVTVAAPGFKTQTQAGVVLKVQDRLNLNFKMAVGEVTQTVEVTTAIPTINTQTSSLGQVLEAKTLTAMPLNGRNYLQLAGLSAGVVETGMGRNSQTNGNTGGSSGQPGQVTFAADGSRGTLNNFILDGIDNNSNDNGGLVINTQVDALQEFKIQTSSYSAEFGRSGGAVINAVTKSGTNSYHGNLFEFFRNSALDARNFFQTTGPKAPFKQNQWGGTIGGYIIKNKLFWFGDYQGTSINNPRPIFSTVPTAAERMGDFSAPGEPTIYDPNTYNPATNTRQSFASEYGNGNRIPAGRIDPISQAFINLYPLPNVPGATKNNFLIDPAAPYLMQQGDFRADYDASANNQGFFRFSNAGLTFLNPPRLPGLAYGQHGGYDYEEIMGAALGETHIFSPTVFNEFRLGFNWYGINQNIPENGLHLPPANLTIPGVPLRANTAGLAQFSPSGYRGLGTPGYAPTLLSTEERQLTDALSIVRGKHSIVMGFEMRWSQFNIFQVPAPNGSLSFSGQFTANPVDGSGGGGLADALLGLPVNATYDTQVEVQNRQRTPSAFIQDDWRVTPTFTLNLGLRYDYFQPIWEKHNQQANFNFKTGQLEVAGQNGNSRTLTVPDHFNFAPRIGFAKTIHQNTVISAGAGLFWSGQEIRTAGGLQLAYNEPFYYQPDFVSDGITPVVTVSGGFPPLNPNQETNPSVTSLDARLRTPSYFEYNLSVQRALPDKMSLELSYAGSKGTHLQSMIDPNQVVTPGPGDVQSRRPYPTFGPFAGISDRGNSRYYSGQAKLQKQTGQGLYFLSSFTWSKAYDDEPEICCSSPWPQNSWNIPSDTGLADFNQTLRWVLSYDYLLPFGPGHRFLGGAGPVLNQIVGGWHLGGIYSLGSGFPFSAALGYDSSNTGTFGTVRADQILPNGNLPASQRSVNNWFNTAAYADPSQRIPGRPYAFGNSGRNTLIGPDTNDFDLSLGKTFPIREAMNVEFRGEFFNVLNHPNFAQPDNVLTDGPGAFGVVTSTGLDNREIQLALKFNF
ncbi:MAG TPA: carboxypeptidase regulatory-like domain-containing protein [Terriglobales bacterium]|nr:carboxypeptidase regulatory-like domain-containing protein [Terriglobales bacterium]